MPPSPAQQPSIHSTQQPSTLPHAPLWRRIAAMVYDSLVVMAIIMAYGAIFIGIKYPLLKTPLVAGERASIGTPGFLGMIIVICAFFCFFWVRSGQTLGMKAWRLQIQAKPSGKPSIRQALIRCLVAPFSFLFLGIGYIWCLFDKDKQSLHDNLSDTRTILLPK